MAVRKFFYHSTRLKVPIGSIRCYTSSSEILVTNQQPMPMPCTSTKATMIAEMKVISVYDSRAMSKSDYVYITQNATTIKTDHIYGTHVNTDIGRYTLDYKALPR